MINFNLQDGYSVVTLPKPSPAPSFDNDEDADGDNKPQLLDSFNLIGNSHTMSNEIPAASSVLSVHEVQFKHAGNYTCAPSNTRPTNINVHVLKGEILPQRASKAIISSLIVLCVRVGAPFTRYTQKARE